jgi:hypothetical protein
MGRSIFHFSIDIFWPSHSDNSNAYFFRVNWWFRTSLIRYSLSACDNFKPQLSFTIAVSKVRVAWRFQTPDLLSSSKTGVNSGIRNWKSTFLIELDVRKPLVESISQRSEELRLYNLV